MRTLAVNSYLLCIATHINFYLSLYRLLDEIRAGVIIREVTKMGYYQTSRQKIDISQVEFAGRVLDIGGGGEGVISRHSKDSVVAIDTRADELAETLDVGLKIIMDACNLQFLDEYFNDITCFFSLMYFDSNQIEKFFCEAHRVLKKEGFLWIWDATMPADCSNEVFVAQLEICISEDEVITPGYGVGWAREHSAGFIKPFYEKAGFELLEINESSESFFIQLRRNFV